MTIEARKELRGLGIPVERYRQYAPGEVISEGIAVYTPQMGMPLLPTPGVARVKTTVLEKGVNYQVHEFGFRSVYYSEDQIASVGKHFVPSESKLFRYSIRKSPNSPDI